MHALRRQTMVSCRIRPHLLPQVWKRRAAALVAALAGHGWHVSMPTACMYVWAKLPDGLTDDLDFCKRLVAETGVALAPGRGFGPGGRGHVRFALVQPEEVLVAAADKIAGLLKRLEAGLTTRGGAGASEAAACPTAGK